MFPLLFILPVLPNTPWKQKTRQSLLPHPKYVSAESWHQRICMSKIENTTPQDKNIVSRRCFTFQTLAMLVLPIRAPIVHAALPRRTILDEERELSELLRKKDEGNRRNALRAAFEAVEKASEQLDEVAEFVNDDWKGIRQFARLFNNSVEREGMEPLTRKLDSRQQRQDSLKLCKQLTKTLQDMDQSAKREDGEGVLANLQKARELMAAFQEFKP